MYPPGLAIEFGHACRLRRPNIELTGIIALFSVPWPTPSVSACAISRGFTCKFPPPLLPRPRAMISLSSRSDKPTKEKRMQNGEYVQAMSEYSHIYCRRQN